MTAPSSLDAKNPQQSRSPTLWIGNAALLVIAGFVSLALDFPDRIELWLAFVVIVIVGVTTQLAECMLPALFVMFALVSLALAFPDWFDLSLALVVIAIVGVASKLVQRKLPSSSPERIQILAIYAISFLLPASYNQSSFGMIEPQWDGSTLDYFRTVQFSQHTWWG
jgi:hypothetical protein